MNFLPGLVRVHLEVRLFHANFLNELFFVVLLKNL
jgi:hypothetical protein